MSDPWERLRDAAQEALNWAWEDLAQRGEEGALFAPMAKWPEASGWLAGGMTMTDDAINRKLAAMLAGWVVDDKHNRDLLAEMLGNERQVAATNMLDANSVVEDVMFAATRWANASSEITQAAGRAVIAEIVRDALSDTVWNTAHWAFANLYAATSGEHPALAEALSATIAHLKQQHPLVIVIEAARAGDLQTLESFVTPPNPATELDPDNPGYPLALELWDAVAQAEIAANA